MSMASSTSTTAPPSEPTTKPMLQKPPGYRDVNTQLPPLPPRKPKLPPSLRRKPKRHGCCCICCCTFCIIIFVLIFGILIAAGLIFLIYDPSLPKFYLGSLRVPKLNVTEKPDGAYLDADTSVRVEVKNPSGKMGWYFDETRVEVWAENGDLNLGSTELPGFEVKEKERKDLKAETSVRDMALDEKQKQKLKRKELVPTVEVRTRTAVGMQGWKSWKLAVVVACGGSSLKQIEDCDTPTCILTTLKWIKVRL